MMNFRLLLSAFFILILQACLGPEQVLISDSNRLFTAKNKQLVQDYYPLETGRHWTYSLKQYQNGKLKDNNRFREMHMEVKELEAQRGVKQAILQRSYTYAPDMVPNPTLAKQFKNRVELSRYQPQFMDIYPQLQAESQGYLTILQMPFVTGHQWPGRAPQETVVIQGFEQINTPAGTFRALKTNHQLKYDDGRENNLYYWYAKNVGMVKLSEEATIYFGEWIHVKSEGQLTALR